MLNPNPTNSSQLAKSIQRDYLRDAETYRLTKESGFQSNGRLIVKIGLAIAAFVTVLAGRSA